MQIYCKQPDYDEDFQKAINIAKRREVSHILEQVGDRIYISVYSQTRPVGRFVFELEEGFCFLRTNNVIEKDYYPFEYAVFFVARYLKKNGIDYLLWQ